MFYAVKGYPQSAWAGRRNGRLPLEAGQAGPPGESQLGVSEAINSVARRKARAFRFAACPNQIDWRCLPAAVSLRGFSRGTRWSSRSVTPLYAAHSVSLTVSASFPAPERPRCDASIRVRRPAPHGRDPAPGDPERRWRNTASIPYLRAFD